MYAVIATYHRPELLRRAVAAAHCFMPGDHEVYVASNQETPPQAPGCRIVWWAKPLRHGEGPGWVRDMGIRHAVKYHKAGTDDVFLMLDDDAALNETFPGALPLIAELLAEPDTGLLRLGLSKPEPRLTTTPFRGTGGGLLFTLKTYLDIGGYTHHFNDDKRLFERAVRHKLVNYQLPDVYSENTRFASGGLTELLGITESMTTEEKWQRKHAARRIADRMGW